MLVCPETKLPVREVSLEEAEAAIGGKIGPVQRSGRPAEPFGTSERVMLREDNGAAYPIARGLPILMAPEVLLPEGTEKRFDLTLPQYAEAYEEMEFYNSVASENAEKVKREADYFYGRVLKLPESERENFPDPKEAWLDASYDCRAQYDAYKHIAPVKDKIVVQLGGSGIAASYFALAGAKECWLLSPMIGEVEFGQLLMEEVGHGDKFRGVVGVGEELPFADGSVDALYSGGCVHHMETATAMPEFRRVLAAGGALAAIDPWKAPLHTFGTKLLGKRETSVYCRPIDPRRLEPLHATFEESTDTRYGALTRYPMLALSKFGIKFHGASLYPLFAFDDAVAGIIPPFRRGWGSSIALLARKAPG
ncbi:MAG: methyltransferase domain-containing protein [Planctomycetota bacterium]